MRASLPEQEGLRNVALAALIQAASRCAASPGHTAQPFKPNETAGRFLIEAWQRDLPEIVRKRVDDIAPVSYTHLDVYKRQAHSSARRQLSSHAETWLVANCNRGKHFNADG